MASIIYKGRRVTANSSSQTVSSGKFPLDYFTVPVLGNSDIKQINFTRSFEYFTVPVLGNSDIKQINFTRSFEYFIYPTVKEPILKATNIYNAAGILQ